MPDQYNKPLIFRSRTLNHLHYMHKSQLVKLVKSFNQFRNQFLFYVKSLQKLIGSMMLISKMHSIFKYFIVPHDFLGFRWNSDLHDSGTISYASIEIERSLPPVKIINQGERIRPIVFVCISLYCTFEILYNALLRILFSKYYYDQIDEFFRFTKTTRYAYSKFSDGCCKN